MIELSVNGTPFTDFISANVTLSMTTLANDFSFTASAVDAFPDFKQGDSVVVLVDGEKKLTGYIDEVNGVDQEGNHIVTYSGRDRTGDFVDSQINVIDELRPSQSLTLKRIIEIVINHLGQDLAVIDELNPAPYNLAEDRVNPQVGDSAFEFVMDLARKRQALLSSNGDGDITIIQSQPTDSGARIQRLLRSDTNNVISQSWNVDSTQVFNVYIHRGQLDPHALNFSGSSGAEAVENQSARVTNSQVRSGRQKVVVEPKGYSNAQLRDRAQWASQLADARAIKYSCVVKGHRNELDELWQENTLSQINSEPANISRKMLLETVTFSQGEGQPTVSTLTFVEKNVYTINSQLLSQKPVGDLNDVFSTLG